MKPLQEFDKYIKGHLPEEETDAFTREIVKQHFEEEALKEKWTELLKDDDELQSLKSAHIKPLPSANKKAFNLRRFLQIAAALLVLLSAALALWQPWSIGSSDTLLAQELEKPFSIISMREGAAQMNETRLKAQEAYRSQNYKDAISSYQELLNNETLLTTDRFYLGLSQLYSGNAVAAVSELEKINNAANVELPKETNWYLALAYAKAGQSEKAIAALQKIVAAGGWKSVEAKALLDTL